MPDHTLTCADLDELRRELLQVTIATDHDCRGLDLEVPLAGGEGS